MKDFNSAWNGVYIRSNLHDVCDHVSGEHILNNSYRLYPSHILYRGISSTVNEIGRIFDDSEKKKLTGKELIDTLTRLIQIIHGKFHFHDVFDFSKFQSTILYQRALQKVELNIGTAESDINEALKRNPSLIEGFLLKARLDLSKNKKTVTLDGLNNE